jgi:hypothetical protein
MIKTLAERRMETLNAYFESKWPLDGPKLEIDFESGDLGQGGHRVDLWRDIIPLINKLETKFEKGHALLEILSVLHVTGGGETVAAVFAEAAVAPGGSFWEANGVKIDKVK